jgi:hypothetical protein
MRLRWRFYRSVAAIETGVALHWLGLGTVDAGRLLKSLQLVEHRAQRLLPTA